jgi:hypothetical protein
VKAPICRHPNLAVFRTILAVIDKVSGRHWSAYASSSSGVRRLLHPLITRWPTNS